MERWNWTDFSAKSVTAEREAAGKRDREIRENNRRRPLEAMTLDQRTLRNDLRIARGLPLDEYR